MSWNWQKPDWPNFTWDQALIDPLEHAFLEGSGLLAGLAKHLRDDDRDHLLTELLSGSALKTSEIEGEFLNRQSVRSSVMTHFGLKPEGRMRTNTAEHGIARLAFDVFDNYAAETSDELFFRWHCWINLGLGDFSSVGLYRCGDTPMQVVSGPSYNAKIHFQAPPSERVQAEMCAFINWVKNSKPGCATVLEPLTRSALAHLYFVSIHPFEDGNGRIARALSEKVVAESMGRPGLLALSQTIAADRNGYYDALERNNKELTVTDWILYFAKTVIEAQKASQAQAEFLIRKVRFFDRYRDKLNSRQKKVLLRMFREGPTGFKGGLSAKNYRSITHTSPATVTRDLRELVAMGALTRTGEKKGTRYHLRLR